MENRSSIWKLPKHDANKILEITMAEVELSEEQGEFHLGITTQIESYGKHQDCFIAYDILNEDSFPIMQAIPRYDPFIKYQSTDSEIKSVIHLPKLIPGTYKLSVWIGPHYSETFDWQQEILSFTITKSPIPDRIFAHSKRNGFMIPYSALKTSHDS